MSEYVKSLYDLIFGYFTNLLALWADPDLAAMLGANFLYLILAVWVCWNAVNIFLIRPMPGGSLFGTLAANLSMRDRNARASSDRDKREAARNEREAQRKSYDHYKTERSRREEYAARYRSEKARK